MAKTEIRAEASLDTTKFQRGLAKADKGVKKFASNAIKSFGAIAGAAGLASLARSAIDLGNEITNLAKLSGTGTTQFQEFAFGARSLGIENEKLGDILKDVSDKVGDFLQTGGGPMKDFFENIAPKVGVTAEQFRNLSGKDALQLYVSSLEKANLSQSEMTFFMEAIASDATLLIPLLTENGKAAGEFAKEARNLGVILDKDTLAKLKLASVEMFKFKNILTVLTGVALTKIIPAFKILGNGIGFIGDVLGVSAANFLAFGSTIGSVLKAVIAPAVSQMEALGLAIKAAGQFASRDFAGAKESLKGAKDAAGDVIDKMKAIPNEIGKAFDKLKSDQKIATDVMGKSIEDRAKSIGDAWGSMTDKMAEDSEDAADKTKASLDSVATSMDSVTKSTKEATDQAEALAVTTEKVAAAATKAATATRSMRKEQEARLNKNISGGMGMTQGLNASSMSTEQIEYEIKKNNEKMKRNALENRNMPGNISTGIFQNQLPIGTNAILQAELDKRDRYQRTGGAGVEFENPALRAQLDRMTTTQNTTQTISHQNEKQIKAMDLMNRNMSRIANTVSKLDRGLS